MSDQDDLTRHSATRSGRDADRATRRVALALVGVIVLATLALAYKAITS